MWVVILLSKPATVRLSCGPSQTIAQEPQGIVKMKVPLESSCSVLVEVKRKGLLVAQLAPSSMNFSTNEPTVYNFNAFVAGTGF